MPNHRYTGKDLYLSFDGTVVSGEWMRFEFERSLAIIDMTAISEADFVGVAGIQQGRWTLTVFDKAVGGEVVAQALTLGTTATLIFGPQGNSSGLPKFGFSAIVTGVNQRYGVDETVIYEFSGIKSGPMLYDFGDVFA